MKSSSFFGGFSPIFWGIFFEASCHLLDQTLYFLRLLAGTAGSGYDDEVHELVPSCPPLRGFPVGKNDEVTTPFAWHEKAVFTLKLRHLDFAWHDVEEELDLLFTPRKELVEDVEDFLVGY